MSDVWALWIVSCEWDSVPYKTAIIITINTDLYQETEFVLIILCEVYIIFTDISFSSFSSSDSTVYWYGGTKHKKQINCPPPPPPLPPPPPPPPISPPPPPPPLYQPPPPSLYQQKWYSSITQVYFFVCFFFSPHLFTLFMFAIPKSITCKAPIPTKI